MAAMIGHHDAEKAFLEPWTSGRLHHAWLLAGPQGMGKGAFAARVARFLVTHDRAGEEGAPLSLDDPGDDQAGRLVAAGNHPEIIHLTRQVKDKSKDLARNITIDQVRGMDVIVTTSARTDEEARELLKLFGFPFPIEAQAKEAA